MENGLFAPVDDTNNVTRVPSRVTRDLQVQSDFANIGRMLEQDKRVLGTDRRGLCCHSALSLLSFIRSSIYPYKNSGVRRNGGPALVQARTAAFCSTS